MTVWLWIPVAPYLLWVALCLAPRWTGRVPGLSTVLGWVLDDVAVTWGNITILLPKLVSETGFWFLPIRTQKHENRHAWQFRTHLFTGLFIYWGYQMRYGFTSNPWELDARAAESR